MKNSDRYQFNKLTGGYSLFKSIILKQTDSFGYKYVQIKYHTGKFKRERVNVLVAKYFVENPNPILYNMVNHKDGNKSNNIASNLEWCNSSMNTQHAYDTGLIDIENFKNIKSSQATPYRVETPENVLLFQTQKQTMQYFNVGKTVFKSNKFIEQKKLEGYKITKISKEEYYEQTGSTTILKQC